MTEYPFTAKDLEALKAWDTPTICNGLEIVAPERRAIGFTVEPMVVVDRKFPPIVGLARTGLIRAKEPPRGPIPPREDWYEYVAADGLPTIAVIQDIDDRPGFGAFWGEVQTTVHAGLGVAGCVTNGSFRDIDMLAPGFQIVGGRIGPSHAHVHMVQMKCDVNIFGMLVGHDDVVHADVHGAVVIPAEAVRALPKAIDLMARREKVILDRARARRLQQRARCARRCAPPAKSTSAARRIAWTLRPFASASSAAASLPKIISRHGRAWTTSCSPPSVTSTSKRRAPPLSATRQELSLRRRRRDARRASGSTSSTSRPRWNRTQVSSGWPRARKLPTIVQKPLAPTLEDCVAIVEGTAAPPAFPSWCMRTRAS